MDARAADSTAGTDSAGSPMRTVTRNTSTRLTMLSPTHARERPARYARRAGLRLRAATASRKVRVPCRTGSARTEAAAAHRHTTDTPPKAAAMAG